VESTYYLGSQTRLSQVSACPQRSPPRNSDVCWNPYFSEEKSGFQQQLEVLGEGFGEDLLTRRASPIFHFCKRFWTAELSSSRMASAAIHRAAFESMRWISFAVLIAALFSVAFLLPIFRSAQLTAFFT